MFRFTFLTLPVFVFEFVVLGSANFRCSNEFPLLLPKYHLMEKCHRSKLGVAAKASFTSLVSCEKLGIEKKALALNFSPPEVDEPLVYTCEVLKCAEADGGLSLVNDTRYDYYSIYAKPLPDINSTCVPATGMFYLLSNKLNYSLATESCKNMSGILADITSEVRTDALGQLLAGYSVDAAFVGLVRSYNSGFVNVNGDHLDCTTYRAWAPGHPKRRLNQTDCVVITRQRTWKSVPCNQRHPALCELIPGGPYRRGSIFVSKNKTGTKILKQNKSFT